MFEADSPEYNAFLLGQEIGKMLPKGRVFFEKNHPQLCKETSKPTELGPLPPNVERELLEGVGRVYFLEIRKNFPATLSMAGEPIRCFGGDIELDHFATGFVNSNKRTLEIADIPKFSSIQHIDSYFKAMDRDICQRISDYRERFAEYHLVDWDAEPIPREGLENRDPDLRNRYGVLKG